MDSGKSQQHRVGESTNNQDGKYCKPTYPLSVTNPGVYGKILGVLLFIQFSLNLNLQMTSPGDFLQRVVVITSQFLTCITSFNYMGLIIYNKEAPNTSIIKMDSLVRSTFVVGYIYTGTTLLYRHGILEGLSPFLTKFLRTLVRLLIKCIAEVLTNY
ncbi:hypothetical protein NCAS_0B05530 [Naumovozyma castellii]|uniref:Uncharacterized protein n=1 Tax=Naumovozyma castellii TaxID=27288 RepID=G0V9M1_NAUCA|nr:hypothetical protein NCAS_0B05530 [Naumovozyma castellii CBS 4309]CCC68637.1 hypothetical protein NCAS_0B05530 [Naumovozyma castellii CBS 4309]